MTAWPQRSAASVDDRRGCRLRSWAYLSNSSSKSADSRASCLLAISWTSDVPLERTATVATDKAAAAQPSAVTAKVAFVQDVSRHHTALEDEEADMQNKSAALHQSRNAPLAGPSKRGLQYAILAISRKRHTKAASAKTYIFTCKARR